MIPRYSIRLAALVACLSAAATVTAQAHELWFQPTAGNADAVRLTFADTPAPGEAERVAEIAHTQVWGDGTPLEVKRLADGLEAKLPAHRPDVLSAYADRGVVDYLGDSFVITLAAYAQAKPARSIDDLKLGLDGDQLRLLLVDGAEGGRPVVRALWKGKPAADAPVEIYRGNKSTQVRTNAKGEIPCPDLDGGPVSLLAVLKVMTPGKRDGRDYSHIRYKATLQLGSLADHAQHARPLPQPNPRLASRTSTARDVFPSPVRLATAASRPSGRN